MRTVIVPNALREAIMARLDAEIAKHPEAGQDREHLYHTILAYYDEYGAIPEFSLEKDEEMETK